MHIVTFPMNFGLASQWSRRNRRRSTRGFTILEILVVLAIIGLLVALTITNFGGIFSQSKETVARLFVQQTMKAPLTAYRINVGDYPSTEEGLQALVTAPADKADRWRGPYVDVTGGKMPLDPWGRPYQYRYPGTHNKDSYDLYSLGPLDNDKVIGNW